MRYLTYEKTQMSERQKAAADAGRMPIRRVIRFNRAWFGVCDGTGEIVALCKDYGAAQLLAGYKS